MTDAIPQIECVLAHPTEQEICIMADIDKKPRKRPDFEAESDPHSPAPPPPPPTPPEPSDG